MKVFISYRREDSAGHSGRLHDSLQSHFGADNVFMDLSDIDSGQNFVDVIQTAIRSSDVVLAVIGKQWLTCSSAGKRRLDLPDDFVRTEIGVALEHGVPVIPVLVQGAGMPLAPIVARTAQAARVARCARSQRRALELRRRPPDRRHRKAGGKAAPGRSGGRSSPPSPQVLVIAAAIGAFYFLRARPTPSFSPAIGARR